MSDSGVNAGWRRESFIARGICPCDPTRGDSCRWCDGTAADERAERVAARERQRDRGAR